LTLGLGVGETAGSPKIVFFFFVSPMCLRPLKRECTSENLAAPALASWRFCLERLNSGRRQPDQLSRKVKIDTVSRAPKVGTKCRWARKSMLKFAEGKRKECALMVISQPD
jgi:hypothetical protein